MSDLTQSRRWTGTCLLCLPRYSNTNVDLLRISRWIWQLARRCANLHRSSSKHGRERFCAGSQAYRLGAFACASCRGNWRTQENLLRVHRIIGRYRTTRLLWFSLSTSFISFDLTLPTMPAKFVIKNCFDMSIVVIEIALLVWIYNQLKNCWELNWVVESNSKLIVWWKNCDTDTSKFGTWF